MYVNVFHRSIHSTQVKVNYLSGKKEKKLLDRQTHDGFQNKTKNIKKNAASLLLTKF